MLAPVRSPLGFLCKARLSACCVLGSALGTGRARADTGPARSTEATTHAQAEAGGGAHRGWGS